MSELDDASPKQPIELKASLQSQQMGESALLVASGPIYPTGHSYKEYRPSVGADIDSVAEAVAELATGQQVAAISVFEGVPIVALPEDTAQSVHTRWQILKLLSSSGVSIEELEALPERSPEVLREEIGIECQRIFGRSLEWWFKDLHRREQLPYTPGLVVDWNKQRTVQWFTIAGQDVPTWLRGSNIDMSTDGSLIKISPQKRIRLTGDDEGPARVGSYAGGGPTLQPIDEPLIFSKLRSESSGETVEQHYARREAAGDAYKNLEDHRLAELLQVMKHLRPI